MPFLSSISCPAMQTDEFPFNISSIKRGFNIHLLKNVTFFVGENGSGKSTLLESVAEKCDFPLRGGSRNHNQALGFRFEGYESPLTKCITLRWTPKRITNGFFMRAESFFNFASYLDDVSEGDSRFFDNWGGKSLHKQSHGESFLSLFSNQFESGIYILDEPEAALSPSRILAFIALIADLEQAGRAQFLIATHSPMLLCYPDCIIYQIDDDGIRETTCEETEHYRLTKSFLDNPAAYLKHLLP